MKKFYQKFIFLPLLIIITGCLLLYSIFLWLLPPIINSQLFLNNFQGIVERKFPVKIQIIGFKLISYPNLHYIIKAENLNLLSQNGNKIFFSENPYLEFNLFNIVPKRINADNIFTDRTLIANLKTPAKTHKNKPVTLKSLPAINIKNTEIKIDDKRTLTLKNFSTKEKNGKSTIKFIAILKSKYLKNELIAGSEGFLTYKDNILKAENFKIKTGSSELDINGTLFNTENNSYNFNIYGKNIPVNSLESGFLFYIKQKKPDKNFIENFYDFSGLANLDLNISKGNITGIAVITNLAAKTVKFSIPIKLPSTEFKFFGNKITAKTQGTFGNEIVYTDFSAEKLFTPDKIIYGTVSSALGEKFTQLYTPDIRITGKIDARVKYQVHKGIVDVEYAAKINKGANLHYKEANLGLMTRDRRMFAQTQKIGNNLYLKNYDYSFVDNNEIKNIILGDGLFVRTNGRYKLDYITCRTNGEAPVSITGSFGKYVNGGTFSGDLKYYYPKNLITGNIFLHNSRYKNFFVKNASIIADTENMEIKADGTFEKSPFYCLINMKNSFNNEIYIRTMKLQLDEYILRRHRGKKKTALKLPENTQNINWIIEKGDLRLGKFRYNKILLESLELSGYLKNDIIKFSMPDIDFAEGKLSAAGNYDINTHSSDITFSAKNIDSNIAADMIFDLKDQIEGSANAKMHLQTYNKLENIHAHTTFSVENGALTKIGNREFIIKKSRGIKKIIKFKLPDIINIDAKKMKALKSNINGSFDVNNHKIENVEIYSKHTYLALFVEGNYNIRKHSANIKLWGKYNRSAQKGIRILCVPLSIITKIIFKPEYTKQIYKDKLNKVPQINAKSFEEENFTVRMRGNLNDNSSIKVEMKSIR